MSFVYALPLNVGVCDCGKCVAKCWRLAADIPPEIENPQDCCHGNVTAPGRATCAL
jgi:hypothetical protein